MKFPAFNTFRYLLTLLILTTSSTCLVQGAMDMFLKIEGIDGESKDSEHQNEIDVLSWSWGMSRSSNNQSGGGGGESRPVIQDINVTQYIDKSSVKLMERCVQGQHIPSAILTVRKTGDTPQEFLVITMRNVLVTSVSTGGSGGEDRLTENVTLNFGEFDVVYTEYDSSGSEEGNTEMTWNIETNSP